MLTGRRKRCASLLAVLAVNLGASIPVNAAPGSIVFTSNRNGPAHMWVMSADGANQRQLTFGTSDDIEPTWSSDGMIAFSRGTGYNQSNFISSAIWVMAADGSAAHALPAPAYTVNYRPSWSPDGRRIAFVRVGQSGTAASNAQIWIMDRDGTRQHPVATGTFPTWAPDGSRLAFECGFDICTAAPTGGEQAQITHTADAVAPNWYPGTKIVYVRSVGTGIALPGGQSTKARQIYVINPDGTGQTRITQDSDNDVFPAWSPDGTTIAFSEGTTTVATVCCGYQIATVNSDGTNNHVLTDASPAEPLLGESFPAFAPNGRVLPAQTPASHPDTDGQANASRLHPPPRSLAPTGWQARGNDVALALTLAALLIRLTARTDRRQLRAATVVNVTSGA